jgi:aldose 1-epimerase
VPPLTSGAAGRNDGWHLQVILLSGGSVVLEQSFGQVDGQAARIVEAHVPSADGSTVDVVLGFDDASQYASSPAYFGATVGRYANRIRRGEFRLNGIDYQVDCNEKSNHLHGGREGWDSRLWASEVHPDGKGVTFRTSSANGEMGFPGRCEVTSSYRLECRELRLTMQAVPDQNTIINMVHHSYFNLAGHGSGDVLLQHMRIPAEFYLPAAGARVRERVSALLRQRRCGNG